MVVDQYIRICRIDDSLREYQKEAKQSIFEAWDRINSVMFQMPTGTGKTKLFTSIISDINQYSVDTKQPVKILVIAHRTELIEQIHEHLSRYHIPHGVIAGGSQRNLRMPVQVASIQTLTNKHNVDEAKKLNVDFLIIDEAHHSLARTYKILWDLYPHAKRLGVTATPWRMSGNGFTDLFDDIIMSWTVKKFISEGFLANYNYFSLKQSSDISKTIDTIDDYDIEGDYKVSALERTMNTNEIRAQLLDSYLTLANEKKGIIYAISQLHSRKICEEFEARGIKIAAIDSKTPKKTRSEIVSDFRKGKISIIVNVDIFSEGFDCPDIEFVQLARPTCSLAKYLQQVGRGLRITANKQACIILDNVGMYQRFGLPDARRHWRHHFIGSNDSTEEIQKVVKRLGDGAGREFNLKEGHEAMVLIQQTADILKEEDNVEITKEHKIGPIRYKSGFVWYDPKHTYDNGVHYYEDMFGRKFCMYSDERSLWHFDRIISTHPLKREGLIPQKSMYDFSWHCNIARIFETYVSYVGLYNDKSDELFEIMDFWNPIANDEEKHIFFNFFGEEMDDQEALEYKSELDNEELHFARSAMRRAYFGTSDMSGIPIALLDYKVIRILPRGIYKIKAILNNGEEKTVFSCNEGSDFANTIDHCEEINLPYYVIGIEDRSLQKRKDRYMLLVDTDASEESFLQFDSEGNFYDEKNSLLNPPKSSGKKKRNRIRIPKATLNNSVNNVSSNNQKQVVNQTIAEEKSYKEKTVGDTVTHDRFGKATILSIDDKYITCQFSGNRIKKFYYPEIFEKGFLK